MNPHAPTHPVLDAQDVYRRVGEITRQLHDSLRELGYDKQIEASLGRLPGARSRLNYIARLTGEAADKVLNAVEAAQATQRELAAAADRAEAALQAGGADAHAFVQQVRAGAARTSEQLTDIMLAQDFHDLTGQTVGKVVEIATAVEAALLRLLLEATPPAATDFGALQGPVPEPAGRSDVVADQAQVDALLEGLGF